MNAPVPNIKIAENFNVQRQMMQEVIEGLSQKQKTLPCKYFYDKKGSELFEKICDLEEYYVTRTEIKLLEQVKYKLADLIGAHAAIVEPGAGAGLKIQKLLQVMQSPELYAPMDISKQFLEFSAEKIREKFSNIRITELQADFTQQLSWPKGVELASGKHVVFFPGSTIGNFPPNEAVDFIQRLGNLINQNGALILGVDLIKDADVLEAAYDDKQGVTAAFNKNILQRINRELGANFELDSFEHQAIFNQEKSRVEMHLTSKIEQSVSINNQVFIFKEGETIHTENSYKYSLDQIETLAALAGYKLIESWQDEDKYFSICYLIKRNEGEHCKRLAEAKLSKSWFVEHIS
jgi:L-histidine Nalpha-methyltransferase